MKNSKGYIYKIAGVLLAAVVIVFALQVLPAAVSAAPASSTEIKDQISKLEDEQAQLEKDLKELEGKLSGNREDLKQIVEQKDALEQSMGVLRTQINNLNEQIAAYTLLIADKQSELDKAKADLEYMRQKNKERIRAMEEGGTLSYWTVLFEASSFSDLLDRINMIQEIAASDSKRIAAMENAAQKVEDAKAVLDLEKAVLAETRKGMEAKKVLLAKRQEEANIILSELIAKDEEYKELLDAAEDAMDKLADKIDDMEIKLSEAEEREYMEWLMSQYDTTRPVFVKDGINWALPVDYYRFSSPFGVRTHPVTGEPQKMHNGVDLTARDGRPIYATRAGIVSYACYDSSGGGNMVCIDHRDGFKSYYMHMNDASVGVVKEGQWVKMGELIGYVGSTGGSTGPHLHLGIRKDGVWVNPAEYLVLSYYYKEY